MGRTAVACTVLAATFGILAGADAAPAAASPVARAVAQAVAGASTADSAHSARTGPSGRGHGAVPGQRRTPERRPRAATKTVRFDGYTLSVPADWPVYRLSRDSTRCVRYDTSAVYLGSPGVNQRCPARLVGQADTVSITASGGPGQQGSPVIELQSAGVGGQVTAQPGGTARAGSVQAGPEQAAPAGQRPGLSVTATYGPDPGMVRQILSSVRDNRTGAPVAIRQAAPAAAPGHASPAPSGTPAAKAPAVQPSAPGASAPPAPSAATPAPSDSTPAPTDSTPLPSDSTPAPADSTPPPAGAAALGAASPARLTVRKAAPLPGFDTCTAPSLKAMRAWRRTYAVAAIYIGGEEMGCDYGNLSASWVRAVKAMGWSLIPIYVGLQAPCDSFSQEIQPWRAAPEGKSSANAAVLDARSFGIGRGAPIYFDMEAYKSRDKKCRDSVLSFLNAWTRQLHHRGYLSGVYSSAASGAADLGSATSVYGRPLAKPDAVWFALWDGQANLAGAPYLLTSWWNHGGRIKQYTGSHWVKVRGVKLDIDSDWVQAPVY